MVEDGAEDPRLVKWCRFGLFIALLLHCIAITLYLLGGRATVVVQHFSNFA
jgi:hypothetical protein